MSGAALHWRASPAPDAPRLSAADVLALVSDPMQVVETRLLAHMDSPMGRIPEVGGHLLGAGGKRLRPLLAVLACRATDAPLHVGIAVACAAELIHTATLFHDDVVDGGAVRRGRPAARKLWGNGIAVLVGDFCFARGLDAVAATGTLGAVEALAAAVTEMAEGEVAQLEGAGDPDATAESYFDVVDRKTGALMAWCARVGGVLPAPLDAALARYGRLLGRAFQITDDVLDCAGDDAASGKSAGRDLQEGKLTLPVLLACEASPALRDDIRSAMGESGVSMQDAARIMQATRAVGGLDRAHTEAMTIARAAVAELQAVPSSPYRDALAALAHLSVDRVA
ncbi:MAG: polyprenyl synthetase family protein [Polyangia bacterium]|jgi:octaprenyl-diphosphate synthase